MTPPDVGLVLVLVWAAPALVAAWLGWLEFRARRGNDLHAHDDGTVHEHFRGHAPHAHPTTMDRYDAWLTRLLGTRDPAEDPADRF